MPDKKINLLINLPDGFYKTPQLADKFKHLEEIAEVRKRSHNTPEEIQGDLSWAEAVIMWSWPVFNEGILAKAPGLKFIGHINGTQTSAKASFARGIAVSEARHCWSPAVAEMALALMLTALRKVGDYHADMRAGKEKWVNVFPTDIDPLERQLTGRSVGIVGFGGIGQRLAELLAPFRIELRVYDPFLPGSVTAKYNAKPVTLMELIQGSEIVVLCAANNKGSEKLVGPKEIEAFQKNSVLVNVGRSSLIDMAALEERLSRQDMVAMLDVFDKEPLERDSSLRKLPNAYLTPHRAGGLMESVERALSMLIGDLEAFLEGRERKYALTEAALPSLPER
ncbi:MAG: NAD(P)-dependent oxidoreductase [Bacillota bacterium]